MSQLQNRAQEFWTKVIDSETIKNGIDLLTALTKCATKLVDTLGLLPNLASVIAIIQSFRGHGKRTIMFQWQIVLCPPF